MTFQNYQIYCGWPLSVKQGSTVLLLALESKEAHCMGLLRSVLKAAARLCPHCCSHAPLSYSADSSRREVTEAEVEQFQRTTRLIVLPIANANGPRLGDGETPDGREGIAVCAFTLI